MDKRKYRVLAADDEYWSRENIRSLISWEEYDFEFLEPACDGEEVLERIPRERPDILLTDINMPFLSGLELLNRLHTEYPDIITVAISGYDDFAKVKGVFLSGGMDYLLKPVGKEELIHVLTKALGILAERESQKTRDEHSRQQEHKISSFLEDREYSSLLSEKLYGHPDSGPHVSSTGTYSEMTTVLVKFSDITGIAAGFGHDVLQMSWSIKTRLRELFGDTGNLVVFNYSNKMTEFLLVGNADTGKLERFVARLFSAFSEQEYGPVTVVIHGQTSSLDDIASVYREMIAELMSRPFRRAHCVLYCRDSEAAPSAALPEKGGEYRLEEELHRLLQAKQKRSAEQLIFTDSGFADCEKNGWTYLDVKQYVGKVTNVFHGYVCSQRPELIARMEELLENIDYYMKCLNAQEVFSTLRIMLDSLWEKEERFHSDSVSGQVEQIHTYIENTYYENITLTALAEAYHVDASYLSRTFSRKYGETIIAFLTRMRMEHAVELMRDPEKKLETIALLVGYDDYNYFNRVFRKKMGASPSEYRAALPADCMKNPRKSEKESSKKYR